MGRRKVLFFGISFGALLCGFTHAACDFVKTIFPGFCFSS